MSSYLQPVFGALTDPGRSRDHNEDRILAGPLPAAQAEVPPWFVFAVADGVGGQQRGDWASETTIAILMEDLAERLDSTPALDALRGAFTHANSSIWTSTVATHPPRPATTLVVALLRHGTLWWANVGDSRAYLVRRGEAMRLTQDHSWVEEQMRAGYMTREEARISDWRNVITRSIGGDADVQVDVGGPIPLRSGDALIVCSDGLHGQVSDEEMAEVVQQLLPEAAAGRLVALSNERGGPDNISVIVCIMFDASSVEARAGSLPIGQQVTRP